MGKRLKARAAATTHPDSGRAVAEIREQLGDATSSGVLFFASTRYDLEHLGREIRAAFRGCGPVVGCTTAGEIGPRGFQQGGITAVGLASDELELTPYLIRSLESPLESAAQIEAKLAVDASAVASSGRRRAGLLLVDGLSKAEERLTYSLYRALGNVPIVGGSAADAMSFEKTHVFYDGEFLSGAAVFTVLSTTLPFAPVKFQHFAPSDRKLVITEADVRTRTVREIDGRPAIEAYSDLVGVPCDRLTAADFSRFPLVRQFCGEGYVRSIQSANEDGSMTFLCAVEEGMVVSIGNRLDPISTLRDELDRARAAVSRPELVIGFDCILRKLDLEAAGLDAEAGAIFAERGVVGFSTYGEQINGLHVNQTFTGLVLGC